MEYQIIKRCILWNSESEVIRYMQPGDKIKVNRIKKHLHCFRAYTDEGYFNINTELGGTYAIAVSKKKGTRRKKVDADDK